MSGILRRIRPARATAHDPEPEQGTVWSTQGEPAHAHDDPAARAAPASVPAGTDLDALVGARPATRRRKRMHGRLRHLRRVREVLLRDLGGMVFELHRAGRADGGPRSPVVAEKLARLDAVSSELRELEDLLSDRRRVVLREPGLGGTCPLCGELFGSDARFCSACGSPVAPGAARPVVATGEQALPRREAERQDPAGPPAGTKAGTAVQATDADAQPTTVQDPVGSPARDRREPDPVTEHHR
jgi:hypothetical protein